MGMMMNRQRYEWETREDAETLARYQDISSDPTRLKQAQDCIADSIATGKKALGVKPDNSPTRHRNPATIKKL